MVKLVLFDIDGTLLWTAGAGRRAMESALMSHFGTCGPPAYRYDGKTDVQIVRESMREAGIGADRIDGALAAVLADYLAGLGRELDGTSLQPFAGVAALLDALEARGDRVLGLLTGNVAGGAAPKLRAAGIEPERFRVCAYGSDHEHRHELPRIALERAATALGAAIPGSMTVIIGDTPNDLECGRRVGARSIGVATGHYSVEELCRYQPSACFPDLSDTDAVMRAIDDA